MHSAATIPPDSLRSYFIEFPPGDEREYVNAYLTPEEVSAYLSIGCTVTPHSEVSHV